MSEYRLWPATNGPSSQASDTDDYSMAVEFYVTSAANITKIHYWASTSLAGTFTGRIYSVDAGGTTGSAVSGTDVTFGAITGPGWNTATLSSPVAATINQRYRATVAFTTTNGYTATANYWNSSSGLGGSLGIADGPLRAPNVDAAEGNRQGSFTAATGMAFPASTFNQANYWIDVTVDDGLPPSGVATLPLGGLTLRGGGGYSDTYSDTYRPEAIITRPGSAALPLGTVHLSASSVSAPPVADPDDAELNVSLYAVDPDDGTLTALPHFTRLAVSEVRNGIGKVEVDYPVYGLNFDLLAANTTADRDLEVEAWLVGRRAGAIRGILTDTAGDDLAEDAVWTFEGWDLNVLLDEVLVWPQAGAEDQELVLTGNNAGTIIAHLITQAQTRGALVGVTAGFTTALDSDGAPWANVVTATFSPTATLLDVLQELIEISMIDGFRLGPDRVLQMWNPDGQGTDLTAAPTPRRLWPATDGPATNEVDTADYTVGVEFYVTEAALLTHVHYWWHGSGADTDHAWRLWQVTGTGNAEADGTLVDSGGAFGPMTNGWNTVTLGAPVALTADTRYRMGVYFTTNNGFTKTNNYWSSGPGASGRSNSLLVAPNSATAGGGRQGSFNTTAGNFPYLEFGTANYWVDVTVEALPSTLAAPVFRRGQNLTESPRRHTVRNSGTTALAVGADNLYVDADDVSALARRGRRIEIAASSNSLKDAGSVTAYAQAALTTLSPGTLEVTHGLIVEPGRPLPWINYGAGDWVWSDTRNTLDRLRIQQLELEYGPDGYAGSVVLNTAVVDRVTAIARKLKRISSGTAVVGTSATPPTEPDLDDGLAPAQVVGVTASSSAYVGNDGVTWASVQAGWLAVTTNSDTSPADDIVGYYPAYRYTGSGMPTSWQVLPQVAGSVTDWSGVVPGKAMEVQVAAVDRWGHVGAWSNSYALTSGADATPPPVPSTPNVDSYLGILTVTWDGLGSVGEAQPVDFARVDVHISTSSGFTPSGATKIDSLRAAGTIAWGGGTYGVTYYAKLVAYDKTGNASAASAQDSAVPTRALADDIADDIIDAAKLSDSIDWGDAISPESITTKHLSVATFDDSAILNGGFEDVAAADPTMPERWTASITSGGTISRTSTAANVASGAAAVSLALTAASGHLEILSAPVPTAPGDLWYVEVDAKASRALTGLQIVVSYSDTTSSSDRTATVTSSLMAVTTSYTAAGTLSFTVPATAGGDPVRYAWIAVGAGQVVGDGAAATVYVDNVRLRRVVGTAEIADAAIVRAKIGNLAVGNAQVEDMEIGKLTAGIMSAIMTISGIIRTASSGDRVEIDADGIHCYDGTDLVFDFDISAGTVYMRGTIEAYQSANDRIVIQPTGTGSSGVSLPEISFYAQPTSPAYQNAFNAGSGRTGLGINSGNSADSGSTRRQTTLQLRPDYFVLFYNTAPGDSAGASQRRGAQVRGDVTSAEVGLYNSSGLCAASVTVEGSNIAAGIFDAGGDVEGGYLSLVRESGGSDTGIGFDNGGAISTYLAFTQAGGVVLHRVASQELSFSSSTTQLIHEPGVRLTMNSSTTILGQAGNTFIRLNNSGNIEFYENNLGYSSLASLKSFVIDHPTDPDRLLVHVCTESPTAGVEYTGTAVVRGGAATVQLPDYFEALCEAAGRTVQLTPVGELCLVAASPVVDGRFTVKCSGPDGTAVDWHVRATRRDTAFDVEPLRSEVNVAGSGPYRWISPEPVLVTATTETAETATAETPQARPGTQRPPRRRGPA